MPTQLDIAWLAGLLDGEGCIAFARRTDYKPKHRLEVRYDVKLAMSCRETVEAAYAIIADIVGDDLVKEPYEERRKVRRRRPLWRCEVSSKNGVYTLLSAVLPYLRTKRIEAMLVLDYLERARHEKRYRATDRDRRLAEIATAIRNGCGEARADALSELGQVIPNQAAPGSALPSADDRAEGVETRPLSPSNNAAHERPAPHPHVAEGEDIVRSPRETSSAGINGLHLEHH